MAELSGGGDPEVAVSDRAGRLVVFDSTNGLVVARLQRPDELPLTAPVVGQFLGVGALQVAVGNVDGVVSIHRGSSLRLHGEARFPGSSFVGDPSAFSFPVPPGELPRDTLVLADSRGRIHALRVDADGTPRLLWDPVAPSDPLATPVTSGSVSLPGEPQLVAATLTGQLVLVNPSTGESRVALLRERQRPAGALVVDDIAGDERDEVIVALDSGEVVARHWVDEGGADMTGALRDLWSARLPWPANADPVLVRSPSDPGLPLLIVPHQGGLTVLDARDGSHVGSASTRFAPEVSSQLAVLARPGEAPSLLFATGRALLRLETGAFFTGEPTPDPRAWRLGQRLGGPIGLARVRQPDGSQRIHAIAANSSGRLLIAALPGGQEPGDLPLWSTRGGTPRRNPVLDAAHASREARRAAFWAGELDRRRAEYRSAIESRDFEAAYAANRWLLEEDPRDTALVREGWQLWWRLNAAVAAILAFFLPAGVVAALLLARWIVRWRRLAREARLALAEGRPEDAERLHGALLALRPGDNPAALVLARLRAQRGDDSLEALALYDRALGSSPGEPALLQARARALLRDGRFGPQEHAFYEAVRDSFADPAPIDYAIGRCLEREGRLDEAARRLRAALRGGHAPDGIYALLCDIYLRTDNRSAKAAAAYRREHPRRRHDLHFLECHLAASVEARHDDQRIESLCREILELEPGHPDARLRLAALRLRENRTAEAVEEAGRALAGAPGHPEAAMLLAHCHLILGHEDTEAQQAYLAALQARPDDPEILRALAGIYQRAGRHDPDAVAIFRRAAQHCPGDLPVLRALAAVGRAQADPAVEASALLAIRDLGAQEAPETVRLAHALVALRRDDDVAESVLREAVRLAPDPRPLREALAPILVRAGRRDTEALVLLERVVEADPARRDEALFLAQAWIAQGRHADAAALARKLAAHHPHDEEVARLLALANFHDNRLDEAIAECLALLERRPGDAEVLVHLALATARKGRRDPHALSLLARALEEQPDNVEVLLAVAALRLVEEQDDEAIALCQRALALRPGAFRDVQALVASAIARRPAAALGWFLARLLAQAGQHGQALAQLLALRDAGHADPRQLLEALDPILEADPGLVDGLALQGQLLAGLGRLAAARVALEEAFRLRPSSPEVLRALVQVLRQQLESHPDPFILFRLGKLHWLNLDHDQAISCFQKTAADYRLEAESTKMLGRCFMAKGMLDLALGEFRKLVIDEEAKELLYDLATRYEKKMDLVGAKTVYRQLFAADIDYKDVRARFESLAAHTSDPLAFDKALVSQQLSISAQRRYELLEEIGRGAMGVVYRARDRELDEVVALKFLPEALSKNPEAVSRFREEVRLARRLSHPNIVRLHDIGEELGRRYISMELVDGPDLRARLRQLDGAPLPPADVLAFGAQLASALAHAHRAGVIHRDIKPANVLLTPDLATAKLADFGLASARQATDAPGAGGTPLYMAPELFQGRAATTRTDIYSLGVLLYEVAAGHAPFTAGDLMEQHLHVAPSRPDAMPDALWAVIARALSKDPAQRQASATEIESALLEIREHATA